MESNKYEPIEFDTEIDVIKHFVNIGDLYVINNGEYEKLEFKRNKFNWDPGLNDFYTKKQPTLEELIAIKPRLCWVWDSCNDNAEREVALIKSVGDGKRRRYVCVGFMSWDNAQMLTDEEIKQFLSGE